MLLLIEFPIAAELRRCAEGFEASWRDHSALGRNRAEALGRLRLVLEEVGMNQLAKLYRPAFLAAVAEG